MYKILIADDEREISNGLARYFPWSEIGFEVVGQCANGRDALSYIEQHEVDVLFCDIVMPLMTGLDVARELHKQKRRVMIVLISGHKNFEYAKQALAYGVKYYIVKPSKYHELIEVFSSLKDELDQRNITSGTSAERTNINDKSILLAISYIQRHLHEATLESTAGRIHLHPNYFSTFFKKQTGQNFSDYLITARMKRAAELLEQIELKTYEISELVGYNNPRNFARTFKKYYGVSPREYRAGDYLRLEASYE